MAGCDPRRRPRTDSRRANEKSLTTDCGVMLALRATLAFGFFGSPPPVVGTLMLARLST